MGSYAIRNSVTAAKDQTYALYNLTQETACPYTSCRLVIMTKASDPQDWQKKLDLPVAHKPDSQDICFVPDGDYASFIEEYTGKTVPEGNFVTPDGKILGRHKGIIHYTVGQRKGLGIVTWREPAICHRDPTRDKRSGDRKPCPGLSDGSSCQPFKFHGKGRYSGRRSCICKDPLQSQRGILPCKADRRR